jgi:hypothetical protein
MERGKRKESVLALFASLSVAVAVYRLVVLCPALYCLATRCLCQLSSSASSCLYILWYSACSAFALHSALLCVALHCPASPSLSSVGRSLQAHTHSTLDPTGGSLAPFVLDPGRLPHHLELPWLPTTTLSTTPPSSTALSLRPRHGCPDCLLPYLHNAHTSQLQFPPRPRLSLVTGGSLQKEQALPSPSLFQPALDVQFHPGCVVSTPSLHSRCPRLSAAAFDNSPLELIWASPSPPPDGPSSRLDALCCLPHWPPCPLQIGEPSKMRLLDQQTFCTARLENSNRYAPSTEPTGSIAPRRVC